MNQVQTRHIDVKDAEIHWEYRCNACGDKTVTSQDFIQYLILKKIKKVDHACLDCKSKNAWEIDFNESTIFSKSDLEADIKKFKEEYKNSLKEAPK